MIPRTLVPFALSPLASAPAAARRTSTPLDARLLVPGDLPPGPLQTKSAIPAHVPLEVLGERVVVPRDLPVVPLERPAAPVHRFPPTTLDARIAVPPDAAPPGPQGWRPASPERLEKARDLLDPDLFTTGEVHLLAHPVEGRTIHWGWVSASSSVVFHTALLVLILMLPRMLPYKPPTQEEIELAHRSLGLVYLPPPAAIVPAVPVPPPQAQIRIDPRVFQQVAPPDVEASPNPGPVEPRSPRPGEREPGSPNDQRAGGEPPARSEPRQVARLEPVPKAAPEAPSGLRLEPRSPGRMLEDSVRGAIRRGPTGDRGEFGDPLPPNVGAGGGRGFVGGTVQILTPTEGVDFTNYVARMLASVRRNWYAVIPESARLGERGVVILDFAVQRDGSVPARQPELMRGSGRDPMDRAAISAIRASNPFEPLPPAFTGPEVRFRFIFLYNMRLSEQ